MTSRGDCIRRVFRSWMTTTMTDAKKSKRDGRSVAARLSSSRVDMIGDESCSDAILNLRWGHWPFQFLGSGSWPEAAGVPRAFRYQFLTEHGLLLACWQANRLVGSFIYDCLPLSAS